MRCAVSIGEIYPFFGFDGQRGACACEAIVTNASLSLCNFYM